MGELILVCLKKSKLLLFELTAPTQCVYIFLSECFGSQIKELIALCLIAQCYFDHAHLISVSDKIVKMAAPMR